MENGLPSRGTMIIRWRQVQMLVSVLEASTMASSTAFSCRKFCDIAQKAIHIELFVVFEFQQVQLVSHVTRLAFAPWPWTD